VVVVVVVGGAGLVVVVVGGAGFGALAAKGVAGAVVAAALARVHVPPKAFTPSPWDCRAPLSPAKVYSGKELNVTCFFPLPRATKPILPLTPAPSETDVVEVDTSRGTHVVRHEPVHFNDPPFSLLRTYNECDD
jgi:hypothetical protein